MEKNFLSLLKDGIPGLPWPRKAELSSGVW